MLKKRLGAEAIEIDWESKSEYHILHLYYKVPSTLIIPEGCRRIGDSAFSRCDRLEEVIIPKSVTDIGPWAFDCCYNLKKVVIPKGVGYIGFCAFRDCKNAEIILEKTKSEIKKIGAGAFNGCRYVKKETRS